MSTWKSAPYESTVLLSYKTAKHLPRRRRRKVERMRLKRAISRAVESISKYRELFMKELSGDVLLEPELLV